jgi:copper(I)-binding protein
MFLLLLILFSVYAGNADIVISDQWMRPGAEKMGTALYFEIKNEGAVADTLYSVSTDISNMVQIHETFSSGNMMGMREIGIIVVQPDASVNLKPGGMHIMVMRLKRDIKVNDEAEFILSFKNPR